LSESAGISDTDPVALADSLRAKAKNEKVLVPVLGLSVDYFLAMLFIAALSVVETFVVFSAVLQLRYQRVGSEEEVFLVAEPPPASASPYSRFLFSSARLGYAVFLLAAALVPPALTLIWGLWLTFHVTFGLFAKGVLFATMASVALCSLNSVINLVLLIWLSWTRGKAKPRAIRRCGNRKARILNIPPFQPVRLPDRGDPGSKNLRRRK
jgi:hypothetical protein